MSPRRILHVDMDAFYAAIEQRDDPALRGQAVIIAHTGPRGVVSTASYEARTFGVRSAMPSSRALQLCPGGVYIEPRLSYYSEVSKAIFAVFAEITPEIEGLSLDEAFLDVTHSEKLFGPASTIAQHLHREVFRRTQLTCSVGLSENKLLAKMASELAKPNGIRALPKSQTNSVLDSMPVDKLYTIGKVSAASLQQLGIRTIGQLRRTPLHLLQRALGNHALTALAFANGDDDRGVDSTRADKSFGAEHTFAQDLTDFAKVKQDLMRLCERIAERARAHHYGAKTLSIKVRIPPFQTFTRQAQLQPISAQTSAIYQLAEQLLSQWWKTQTAPQLRLLGVSISDLSSSDTTAVSENLAPAQLDLFASSNHQAEGLTAKPTDQLSDAINAKFGAGSLRRARGLSP